MRNDRGQFTPKSDSLSKSIGLRVHKSLYPLLEAVAAAEKRSIAELAREAVEGSLLQRQWQVSIPQAEEASPPLDGTIVTVEKINGSIAVCQTAEGKSVEVAIEWLKSI